MESVQKYLELDKKFDLNNPSAYLRILREIKGIWGCKRIDLSAEKLIKEEIFEYLDHSFDKIFQNKDRYFRVITIEERLEISRFMINFIK